MVIIREYREQGEFKLDDNSAEYHFFPTKALLIIIDNDEDEVTHIPIREHDDYGLMSWATHDKCWTPFTDQIQHLYQGWKAEQALLK